MAGRQGFTGGAVNYAPKMSVSPERTEVESVLGVIPGVQGIGEGRTKIGEPAWIAYVRDRAAADRLPKEAAGRPVMVEVSGEIDILPAR